LTEIRAADLRFTPAEAAVFLIKKLKIPVDDGTAALPDKKTEGWVTGCVWPALTYGTRTI
jgi:LuxR family maltose regulon positive regulatory protein